MNEKLFLTSAVPRKIRCAQARFVKTVSTTKKRILLNLHNFHIINYFYYITLN